MRPRWAILGAVLVLAGCLRSSIVVCDGRVCVEGYFCHAVTGVETCVTDDQLAQCSDKPDLAACDDSDDRKKCIDGACIAPCGNGTRDAGEDCDDGNTTAGDGCSPTCLDEICGNATIDLVRGEECDNSNVRVSGDGCSSLCDVEEAAWQNITPTPIEARAGVALGLFETNKQVVAFGGAGPNTLFGDTWLWSVGTKQWQRYVPARSPSPRAEHSMVYDVARQKPDPVRWVRRRGRAQRHLGVGRHRLDAAHAGDLSAGSVRDAARVRSRSPEGRAVRWE